MPAAKEVFDGLFDSFLESDFFGPSKHTIVFTILTAGTFNPATGQSTGSTSDIYSADGFFRAPLEKEFREIKASDNVFTCKQDDLGYTPQYNDKCTSGGVTYTVVEVISDKVGGEGNSGVTHKIQLRSS